MQDWQVALIGLLGVILGIGASAFWNWLDRRERYRVMTFEKRLAAHQEAFSWNQRAYHVLGSRDVQGIRDIAQQGREWWNKNALLLDKKSRQSMLPVFNAMELYTNEIEHPVQESHLGQNVWRYVHENLKDITNGIGAGHLPRLIDGNTSTQTQNRDNGDERCSWKRFTAKLREDKALLPFVVVVTVTVVILVVLAFQIPVDVETDRPTLYTLTERRSYVCYGIASMLASIAALLASRKRCIRIMIITAIELFLGGMIFQVLGFLTLPKFFTATWCTIFTG